MSAVVSKIKPVNNVNLKEILHTRGTNKYTYVYDNGARVRYQREEDPNLLLIAVKPPIKSHYRTLILTEEAANLLQEYMVGNSKEDEVHKITVYTGKKRQFYLSRLEDGGFSIGISNISYIVRIQIESFMVASLKFELGNFLPMGIFSRAFTAKAKKAMADL